MKITDELRARILKVHASDPDVSNVLLGERFRVSTATISALIGPKPKPLAPAERPGPPYVAECVCGWSYLGPRARVLYQRREHYRHHPAGVPKAHTTMRRAA